MVAASGSAPTASRARELAYHRSSVSTRARDSLLLGLGALLIRLPAYFAPRHLGFDDGQFAESVLAMRAGGLPFRQVFSSQGPLFLPLAWLGDLLSFRTLDSPRAIAVASGVGLTVVAYLAARELTSRAGALLAAGLVAISGSILWTTGPLTSDGPGELLATSAVALALVYRRRPSTAKAVWIGVLAGAAFSVKSLLVLPALAAVVLVLLARRHWRHIVLVGGVAIGVALAVSLPWGLGRRLRAVGALPHRPGGAARGRREPEQERAHAVRA